jgi:peroxiredoxin
MKNFLEKPAIPFQLQDANGGFYKLDDFAGRWLLMVFHRHLG